VTGEEQGLSELALYRKYRSSDFGAVIGQPQVVDTLKAALASGRLSHAYLFTGPRGVGKTSVARLLARAANCTHEAAASRPCGQCQNCKAEIGSHLDLIEIDAASNRGIDDARALREKITSAPSMGTYKVYIIDEVHMLTTEAFNALLKTLEEPPAHAIFILATTEVHKLPETIISRTQRFSFKPIETGAMTAHLKAIAAKESIAIDDEALEVIAASSRGGFRDAISLLDQAANSGAGQLTAASIRDLLGQGDPALMYDIMQAVATQQPAKLLQSLDKAWEAGLQPAQLARQLIVAWRAKLKEAVLHEDKIAEVGAAVRAIEALLPVQRTTWPELALEAALVRLTADMQAEGPAVITAAPKPVRQAAPVAASKPVEAAKEPEAPVAPVPNGQPNGDLWIKTLTQIKAKNHALYALVGSHCSVRFDGDDLILGCRFSFHRDRIKETKNMQIIEQTLQKVYGHKFRVIPQIEAKTPAPVASSPDASAELMTSALEILGGEVIDG
jgi:DNA polymerase-3 subunit gamma/tau